MKNSDQLSFEINLLPVISILAVCLSFLLLTAVWVKIGTMDVSQSVGTSAENTEAPSIWISLNKPNNIQIKLKGSQILNKLTPINIVAKDSNINWTYLSETIELIKGKYDKIDTAFILPSPSTAYEDVINLIDQLRKAKINQVGISPIQ